VSDADETARHHVLKEPSDELDSIERHDFLGISVRIVLPMERHGSIVDSCQPMIRDRHAVSVTGQVFEHLFRSAEWRFGMNHPFRSAKRVEPPTELQRITIRLMAAKNCLTSSRLRTTGKRFGILAQTISSFGQSLPRVVR
jgi:hypothetical protein